MNFDGTFDSVQTLAHELGHAYHNTNSPTARRCSGRRRWPWPRPPASSARRSSSRPACAAAATTRPRLALLDADLQGATQVVVDIHSRFLFEREVFERRAERTLSVDELRRADARRRSARPTATGSTRRRSTRTCGR